ncbi:MAG: sporulation protein YqfD [Oscillospiraceae bacterium]|jgi:similar to stage IV sporulation protein|nr:sporulation protein YqfD [Oscillospiraceae bacterium]
MLLVRLLRFLRGYLFFRAADGFPERFLNLCHTQGARVWDVAFRSGVLTGQTTIEGYKAMQDFAERAGVALGIEKKCGLPFFLHDYRRRAGLLLGLVIFLAGLRFLSGMVWSVSVTGNERVAAEIIRVAAEEQGLRLGAKAKTLDLRRMSEAALLKLPELSWLSMNLQGSTAVIEVRERLPDTVPPAPVPQSIVAGKAGQLAVLQVYSGKPLKKAGDAVPKGEILASGRIENKDGTTRSTAAAAYAVARVPLEMEVTVPRDYVAGRAQNVQTRYIVYFLGLRLSLQKKLAPQDGGILLRSSLTWAPAGKEMPAAVVRESLLEISAESSSFSDARLALAAAERYYDKAFRTLRGVQIIDQGVSVALTPEGCRIRLIGHCYENIGVAEEITE